MPASWPVPSTTLDTSKVCEVEAGLHGQILTVEEHFRQLSDATTFGFTIDEPNSANVDDETMHELVSIPLFQLR